MKRINNVSLLFIVGILLVSGCSEHPIFSSHEIVHDSVDHNNREHSVDSSQGKADTQTNQAEQAQNNRAEEVESSGEYLLDPPIRMITEQIGYGRQHSYILDDVFYYSIYKTVDGGLSWYPIAEDISSIVDLFILDEDRLWVMQQGEPTPIYEEGTDYALEYDIPYHVLFTEDGGAIWTELSSFTSRVSYRGHYDSFTFVNERIGFVSITIARGNAYSAQTIFRTQDGGLSWEEQGVASCDGVHSEIAFLDEQVGWYGSMLTNTLCETRDGGKSWSEITLPKLTDSPSEILYYNTEPFFFNQRDGILLSYHKPYLEPTEGFTVNLLRTADGGDTWRIQEEATLVLNNAVNRDSDSEYPRSIQFIDEGTGWMLTSEQRLLRYLPAEKSWQTLHDAESLIGYPRKEQYIYTIEFVSAERGWALAGTREHKWLFQTRDGGKTWQVLDVRILD